VGGVPSERDDQSRVNQFDLAYQIRLAALDFVRLRIAIAGWTAFENIRYVHFLARKPERLDHRIRQLTSATDEGAPCRSSSAPEASPTKATALADCRRRDGLRAGRMRAQRVHARNAVRSGLASPCRRSARMDVVRHGGSRRGASGIRRCRIDRRCWNRRRCAHSTEASKASR
jgi:hypothetical protein